MILSALLALSLVQGIPARAFAFDTVPGRIDSIVARASRDSTLKVTRNGPAVVILEGARRRLADSLPVWCRDGCVWEWDELVSGGEKVAQPASSLSGPAWGVDAVGAPAAWAMGARGQGVIVTSLDSGIDPNHLGYTVADGYNAVTRTEGDWADNIAGCNGHGTHVAGTMAGKNGYGVAPEARLFGVKVFEPIPCGSYVSSQAAGIQWAAANGSRCINISISGSNSYGLNQLIGTLRASGVLVTRSNGNSGTTPPQGTTNEIQVASVGGGLTRSGFSNYGSDPMTDLAAPGEGVVSTMPGGGYGTKSGTSMAAPHVCGAAALVMSADPSLSADSVLALLTRSAVPIGTPTPNIYTGSGLVRPDRAIALHRGGAAVAGDTVLTFQASAPVTRCQPVVSVRPWTATSTAPGVTVTTTPDQVCIAVDPALAPSSITVPLTVTSDGPPLPVASITVDTLTRYQTMSGWEVTAQAGQESPNFLLWQGAVLDSAVAAGVNRLRVEVISGAENTTDAYALYRAGAITSTEWKARRYAWTNDNADPNAINPAGFHFSKLDSAMVNIAVPLRNRLIARGESLYLSLNYVSFGASVAQADQNEYAELMLATFQHLQARYGFVPDAVEVILEPDNNTIWNGTAIGRAIAATGARLAAAGFRPDFIAPSTMSMAQAVPYLDAIALVPGALTYLREVAYHRYAGVSDAALTGVATRATALGLRTAMLEHIGSGVDALLADVTTGRASAWQQYTLAFPTTDDGAQLFPISGTTVTTGSRTRLLAPVYSAVKRGAVRVASTSPDYVTAAFRNPDGRYVVVVRSRAAGAVTLRGLPAGRYATTFAPESGSAVVGTVTVAGPLAVTLPAAGVYVVRGTP